MEQQHDADANQFEQQWRPVLPGSLWPTGEEMLAFFAGALPEAEAARVRERILASPRALRDYAHITDRTVAQVQAELQSASASGASVVAGVIAEVEGAIAGVMEIVRRAAQLLKTPSTPIAAYRGDGAPEAQSYEVAGEPAAVILIEQTPVTLRRYHITGQVVFNAAEENALGEFLLSHNEMLKGQGEVSETGSFDLGTLPGGIYRLEILIRSQVIDLRELRVGDVTEQFAMLGTESDILDLKAQSEMFYASDPPLALRLATQAYDLALHIGTPRALGLGHLVLGNVHAFSDDLERVRLSISHYEQASQLFDATGETHRKARMQIGYVYALAQLDETAQAIAVAGAAQPVLKAARDLDGLSRLLMSLGVAYDIQGNAEKALMIYDQRLLILEALPQQESEIGRTHINRAVALLALNEFAEAEYALELAQTLLMQDPLDNQADLAKLALSLGNACAAQKQYQTAIPAYKKAWALFDGLGQPTQAALARLFWALAQVNSHEADQITAGESALVALLPDLERIGQRDERGLALLGMARARIYAGAWHLAQAGLSQVLALATEPGTAPLRIQAHLLAAEIAAATDQAALAQRELKQAIAEVEAGEGDVLDQTLRASWLSDKLAPYHRLVRWLWAQGDVATALEIAQQAKARELRRSLDSEAGSLTQQLGRVAPDLADDIAQLRHALGQLRREMRLEKWRQEDAGVPSSSLNDLTRQASQVEQQLHLAVVHAHQMLHPDAPSVQTWRCTELAKALAPNELLIEYLWGEECIWAWAATQRGIVAHHMVENVAEVSLWCDSYGQAIQRALNAWTKPAAPRLAAGLLGDVDAIGKKLYASLILPFGALDSPEMFNVDATGNAMPRTLVIAGDGKLNQLPFHALPQPNGLPLLHEVEVRYVPGAALMQTVPPTQRHSPVRAVGILGAAEHAAQARRELDALQACFGAAARLEDESIDLARLAEAARTCTWLHLATHAALHPRDPQLSSFALGARDVTLAEVADFEFRQACVVLSACETALGQHKGSDVFSLARAFMGAGATTLITSLWRVADEVIAEVMQAFYANLAQGQRVAQALRHAQLSACAHGAGSLRAHPALWAPMIVFGSDVLVSLHSD